MIEIKIISEKEDIQKNFEIRHHVFHKEMGIHSTSEFDKYDKKNLCTYFLAIYKNKPCGAARTRIEENFIIVERVCVLKEFRGLGIGKEIIKTIVKENNIALNFSLFSPISSIIFFTQFGFKSKAGKKNKNDEPVQYMERKNNI